jgi:hypothetical protein
MIREVRPEDIREFVNRDWERVARAKRSRWSARRREFGPVEGFRIAAELYEHVRLTRSDWPSAQSRLADLEHHRELSEQLRAHVRRPVTG